MIWLLSITVIHTDHINSKDLSLHFLRLEENDNWDLYQNNFKVFHPITIHTAPSTHWIYPKAVLSSDWISDAATISNILGWFVYQNTIVWIRIKTKW